MPSPTLTVVVASVESERSLERALSSLARSCSAIESEILVVDASGDGSAALARAHDSEVTVLSRRPGTLVPELWAEGIRRSSGRYVALTTGHCIVPPGWATALVSALKEGARAAGAGIVPTADAGGLDRAVCYLRYARFLTLTRGATRPAADVPGDNAAYGGDEARDFVGRHHRGFWELDLHHEIERDGGRIMAVPPATAELGPSYPLGVILRHRFRHGRHHGAARVRHGQSRARVLIPSPFVPLVLFARAARVALGTAGHRISFLRGTLPFLALAAAWAAGEAVGAVRGPGLDERRP